MSGFLSSKMKFNDKELAKWSTMFTPDKEGLLEKKGAGKGQGYKLRWFRLKGNLLFYFKVDDCGGWEHGDPVGVIILERVHVDRVHNDTRPYSFVLQFENDDSRTYFLSAYSEVEMEGWIIAIKMSSYEGLKATLYQLQNKIMGLTGEDPLKNKGVSIIGSQISPSEKPREKEARRTLYARSSNKVRALKLHSVTAEASPEEKPQFELSLCCSTLPVGEKGEPPTTKVRVRSFAGTRGTALATLSHTEVIENSSSPCYSHLVLLELGPLCPPGGSLEFEVFSVMQTKKRTMSDCALDSIEDSTENLSGGVVLMSQEDSENTVTLQVGKIIGKAKCSISEITRRTKELKLALSQGHMVCGFLVVKATRVADPERAIQPRRNALSNFTEKASPNGVLPNILSNVIRCHFSFPSTNTATSNDKLKVLEEMYECIFNVQVPIELLKCYNREDIALLRELYAVGALDDQWRSVLQEYKEMLTDSIESYNQAISDLEDLGDTCGFKQSTQKRDETLQFIPCNLHLQRMRVQSQGNAERTYNFVTLGCPADHIRGFKNGGLKRLLSECRSSPSFICKWTESNKAIAIKQNIAKLLDIRTTIHKCNNALYSASAGANPGDMNQAMTQISKQIQLLLWMMDSKVVKEAVEGLIMARPNSAPATTPPLSREAKRMSMKRRSIVPGKCSCGKCSKCVPSPSDWIWNGSKFVQTSKEWMISDSINSIQKNLVRLIELVEKATRQVVDQQHLAVASEQAIGISTFKPTYVWSDELIPEFSKLKQTLEGLFRVAITSLSFALVQLDSYVKGLKTLKLRKDVAFSQALTSLVTSFYISLSQNFTDPVYLHQIRTIGYLVQFESLLSSVGDESGMLEDMCVAVAELASVKFQLVELRGAESSIDFQIKGSRDSLIVQLLIASEILAFLPDRQLQVGELVSVVPVLFTQGVNEKQTLAHIKHDFHMATSLQLQDELNSQSLEALCLYIDKFLDFVKTHHSTSSQAKLRAVRVEDLLNHLKTTYSSQKSKNIEFLVALQQLIHWIRGGRLTSCKSGKDRTSMSVTLEECCVLRNNHHLPGSEFSKTLSTLRSHGTRLENCLKNTGHKCYHFNQIQLVLLPKLLTPPPFTCKNPE